MGRRRISSVHGLLVVDKPKGPTSHDVVGWARRALQTRTVGHAGTLDPMATGVLVLGVGEGTKLLRWLTADSKRYRATVRLGVETDSLDADGVVTGEQPITPLTEAEARDGLAARVGPQAQRPPAYSAVKVDGERAHRLARRGDAVELPPRDIVVHELSLTDLAWPDLSFEAHLSKGAYVRSLARDLANDWGTVGHLVALRRIASGAFTMSEAVSADALRAARDEPSDAAATLPLLPLEAVRRAMPAAVLTADGAAGRPPRPTDPGADDSATGAAGAGRGCGRAPRPGRAPRGGGASRRRRPAGRARHPRRLDLVPAHSRVAERLSTLAHR